MNEKLIAFGQRLKQLREERGLSQEGLADRAELDRTYISLLERGKRNPGLMNLLRLASALGIDVSELVRGLQD